MVVILLALHILVVVFVLAAKDLLVAVIGLSVLSFLSALLFFFLDAPDVALTEAAVGTGVTSFLFIWFVRKTGRDERR